MTKKVHFVPQERRVAFAKVGRSVADARVRHVHVGSVVFTCGEAPYHNLISHNNPFSRTHTVGCKNTAIQQDVSKLSNNK